MLDGSFVKNMIIANVISFLIIVAILALIVIIAKIKQDLQLKKKKMSGDIGWEA